LQVGLSTRTHDTSPHLFQLWLATVHFAYLLGSQGLLQQLERLLLAGLPGGLLIRVVQRLVTRVEALVRPRIPYRSVVIGVVRRLVRRRRR
jgi:hypothetical protein